VRPADLWRRIGVERPPRKAQALDVAPEVGRSELAERRDELTRQYTELQFDLGGLVYEMAIRDHFRVDLVARQAAKLQEVDAELAEAERVLKLEDAGASGNCPACGALHARGAAFCWQCGKELSGRTAISGNGSGSAHDPAGGGGAAG
jgi:hypothetical protein